MTDTPFSQFEQNLHHLSLSFPHATTNQFLLLRLFHYISPRIITALNQALTPYHLQHHEWAVLLMTYTAPQQQILPSTLSDLLDLTRTSLTRLSDELVTKGLLARQENHQDRRQIILQLTKAGHECIQKVIPICAAAHQDILAPFSDAQCQHLTDLLRQLLAHLNHEPAIAASHHTTPNFHRTEDTFLHYHSNAYAIGEHGNQEIQAWLAGKQPHYA